MYVCVCARYLNTFTIFGVNVHISLSKSISVFFYLGYTDDARTGPTVLARQRCVWLHLKSLSYLQWVSFSGTLKSPEPLGSPVRLGAPLSTPHPLCDPCVLKPVLKKTPNEVH